MINWYSIVTSAAAVAVLAAMLPWLLDQLRRAAAAQRAKQLVVRAMKASDIDDDAINQAVALWMENGLPRATNVKDTVSWLSQVSDPLVKSPPMKEHFIVCSEGGKVCAAYWGTEYQETSSPSLWIWFLAHDRRSVRATLGGTKKLYDHIDSLLRSQPKMMVCFELYGPEDIDGVPPQRSIARFKTFDSLLRERGFGVYMLDTVVHYPPDDVSSIQRARDSAIPCRDGYTPLLLVVARRDWIPSVEASHKMTEPQAKELLDDVFDRVYAGFFDNGPEDFEFSSAEVIDYYRFVREGKAATCESWRANGWRLLSRPAVMDRWEAGRELRRLRARKARELH